MRSFKRQLQLLPKPALPEMSGQKPGKMDGKPGNRTASCALFYSFFIIRFNCIRDTLRLIHVVFTLPEVLNKTALHAPKMLYDILFESAWETLQTFGENRGLKMGMIAVLHTWG